MEFMPLHPSSFQKLDQKVVDDLRHVSLHKMSGAGDSRDAQVGDVLVEVFCRLPKKDRLALSPDQQCRDVDRTHVLPQLSAIAADSAVIVRHAASCREI